ncbi:MAG TPA: PmoA family protein [Verrucomicrobiae bacterium]|nr:PmoA family protein [Verrucomicrobiae bacterium]
MAIPLPPGHPLAKGASGGAGVVLSANGAKVPGAILPSGNGSELLLVLDGIAAGEKRAFEISAGGSPARDAIALSADGDRIKVSAGDRPLTAYDPAVKTMEKIWPVLHPLYGPAGAMLTRAFPLDGPPGDTKDHPHHQSVWTAHGDVNGINFWALKEGHGLVHQRECKQSCAPAAGRISAALDWCDASGKKVLEEQRTITFWATPETARIIDFDATFRATEGDVKFGDTKEGGLLSVRLADSMREKQTGNAPPGKIITSEGAIGEKDAWGKSAAWCDYSGPVGNATAGVTLLAHPENSVHPMHWHVRAYGLMTANPFGLSEFAKDKTIDGSRTLKKGESWRMRFRLIAHAGGADEAGLVGAYRDYAGPPSAELR